jgi:hypothetical protein
MPSAARWLFSAGGILPVTGSASANVKIWSFPMVNTSTMDSGRIRLGGGFRLPATSKITLGGGFRLPATRPISGKITLGGGFRLPVAR